MLSNGQLQLYVVLQAGTKGSTASMCTLLSYTMGQHSKARVQLCLTRPRLFAESLVQKEALTIGNFSQELP